MVKVSPEAAVKLKEALTAQGREDLAVRVYVKPGGCSGFSYGMGLDEAKDGDEEVSSEGLRIVVDRFSAQYLEGVEVDYQSGPDMLAGGFTILNPNAASSCGCGSSFRPKDEDMDGEACGSGGGGCGCGSGGCC